MLRGQQLEQPLGQPRLAQQFQLERVVQLRGADGVRLRVRRLLLVVVASASDTTGYAAEQAFDEASSICDESAHYQRF